jgi:hypothetical protein
MFGALWEVVDSSALNTTTLMCTLELMRTRLKFIKGEQPAEVGPLSMKMQATNGELWRVGTICAFRNQA